MGDKPDYTPMTSGPFFFAGWIAAVVLVLIALGGLVLAREVWIRSQTAALQAEQQLGPLVLVTPVQRKPIKRKLNYPADIHGYYENAIYPKVAGYVKSILVDKGALVKKEQLVAIIASPELDQQVAEAKSAYGISAITDRRNQELVRAHVVSQETADTSHATMVSNRAKWQSLVAQQNYERVLAPYDGVVTSRNLDPGALVAVGTAEQGARPIITTATLKPLRVYVKLPQDDAAFVKDGDPVLITVSQLPGRTFTGSVTRHPQALLTDTRTMPVEVDLSNEDLALLPGMYAHAEITLSASAGAPLVPDDALVFADGKVYVPTVKNSRIQLVEVRLGEDDGIHCEIVQGLTGDEMVAINLGQTAQNGQLVRTQLADH